MLTPHLGRIEIQLLCDLVEVNLKRVTRLRRSVSAFWTAGRLVRKHTCALKFVPGHFISDGLQGAGVERACDSITSIGAAIEKRFEVHRGDRAVFLHTGLDVHEHRMAAAMTIENFFACQRALHRPAGNHRELADDDFMIERIALAAKAAPVRSRDHANMTRWNLEHFRERSMNLMRCLRRTPQRHILIMIEVSYG